MSGKQKRRLATTQECETYNVQFRFSLAEYNLFIDWYKRVILFGAKSFLFPRIDSTTKELVEYRLSSSSTPQFSNPSGDMVECSMIWERV